MFTGIIEEIGTIRNIRKGSNAVQLTVGARMILADVKVGDSINTQGVCLTVTSFTADAFTADVMPETMSRTAFSRFRVGSGVNLERALRLNDRLGGHIVSGHIDGTGNVISIRKDENAVWYRVSASPAILRYIIEKGSVALDGISLTVAAVDRASFEVSIIPHTQEQTTLPGLHTGDPVNIECDMLGKYIEKLIEPGQNRKGMDLNFLTKNDFI